MNCPVVLLALALLTGTQAFVLRDEPDSKMAHFSQKLKEHLVNLRRTVGESMDSVLEVEFFSQLTQNLTANYLEARESLYNLEQTLPTETKQLYDLVLKTPWGMWNKALDTVKEQRKKLSSATEEISETLPHLLKPYVDPVLQRAAPYAEHLQSVLTTTGAELKAKMNKTLAQRMEDLGSQLTPLATEVQDHWNGLQMSFFTEPVKEELLRVLETINNSLVKTFVSPLLEIVPSRTKH
ncbi:uncharacterized protein LOC143837131 [Paroedura picta]|uniref:uncharacterized protein LOC143837131 n=1 Tax=Paroedura picta TaxID=143630 RepID=UPI00405751F0